MRHTLAIDFLAYESANLLGVEPVNKSPRQYVADNEQ